MKPEMSSPTCSYFLNVINGDTCVLFFPSDTVCRLMVPIFRSSGIKCLFIGKSWLLPTDRGSTIFLRFWMDHSQLTGNVLPLHSTRESVFTKIVAFSLSSSKLES
jgi:hypothetical protein